MSDYNDTRKEIKQANKAIEAAQSDEVELATFFSRHDELIDNEANRNIVRQYFAGDEITVEALEESYTGHPKFKDMLCTQTEKELRDSLESKIVELLRNGTSPDNIRAAKMTFRFKSIGQLKERLAELERRSSFRSQTPEQLREYIRRPQPGYAELPPMYRHREMILTLEPAKLAHFITKYGSDAINAVLNQREK